MDEEIQKLLDNGIDIDSINDEQSPIYQSVDIHRLRLLSVLDRALEKIAIAYALEELLSEHVSALSQYMTRNEIDALVTTFKLARRLEEENPMHLMTSVLKRSAFFQPFYLSARSLDTVSDLTFAKCSKDSSQVSTSSRKSIDEKRISAKTGLMKSYYTHILAKLQFIPEVPNFARSIISRRPIGDLKYYIYLQDLRNYVCRLIYETKTQEMNQKKNVKLAYVRNLREKPQTEALKKYIQDKRNEAEKIARTLKQEIGKEIEIQDEMNIRVISDSEEMILESETRLIDRTLTSREVQEANKRELNEQLGCYNSILNADLKNIDKLRRRIKKIEVAYKNILDDYDNTIGALHEHYEAIYEIYEKVKEKYDRLKIDFDMQEIEYNDLMQEREHLVEMTCLRIKYNRAAKLIDRWWRKILMKRWKWKKRYLNIQLKKRSLSRSQEYKLRKAIKKLQAKAKDQTKRLKFKY